REEFSHFPAVAEAARSGRLPDPCSDASVAASRVVPGPDAAAWRAHVKTLLTLRRQLLRPRLASLAGGEQHAARCAGRALEVRWRFADGVWQLQANLGPEPAPEGALDPPDARAALTVGDAAGARLGAWSARWHWLGR